MTAQTLDILERAEFSPMLSRLVAEAIEVEVRAQQSNLRDFISDRLATKTELAEVRTDVIKWMFLFMVGQTTILFGGVVFLFHPLIKT